MKVILPSPSIKQQPREILASSSVLPGKETSSLKSLQKFEGYTIPHGLFPHKDISFKFTLTVSDRSVPTGQRLPSAGDAQI